MSKLDLVVFVVSMFFSCAALTFSILSWLSVT